MNLTFEQFYKLKQDISSFVAQKTDLIDIKKWCEQKIMRFLAQLPNSLSHNYVTGDQINNEFKAKIDHVIDYLSKLDLQNRTAQFRGNFIQVEKNADEWSKASQKRGEKLKDITEQGLKTIFVFNDGFKLVQLMTKPHCEREGNLMGHCIGGYDPKKSINFSLRDPQNKPHVTMEIKNGNKIAQIKGKGNTAPIEKYQKYIRYFLQKNDQYKVTNDGENIGYVQWKNMYYDPNSSQWSDIYNNKIIPAQKRAIEKIRSQIVNGTIENIHLAGLFLKELPDFSDIIVKGLFNCSGNQLTSLQGAPQTVGGNFYCNHNQLTSLQGAPQTVGGNFYCSNNQLTSLQGAPQTVEGDFYCNHNQLTSLQGAPQIVEGDFYCNHNQLTSLQGAPQTVKGLFSCSGNQLTSLQGAPQTVGGNFYCNHNQLTSLQGAPQIVGGRFYCNHNQLTSLQGAPKNTKIFR